MILALLTILYAILIFSMGSSAFGYLIHRWNNPDYNYSYLIPLIILYFLWRDRHRISSIPISPSWSGMLLLTVSGVLFWFGELGGEFTLIFLSWWFAAMGIVVLHLGWKRLRAVGIAFVLALMVIPLPNFFASHLTLKLRLISSALGTYLIRLAGMSAYRDGNIIDLGFTSLQVVDACSGLRYFFPIVVLAILIAYLNRLTVIRGIILLCIAIPMVVCINAIRIAITAYLYPWFGQAVAEGFFHDFAGWFTFLLAILVLMPLGVLLKKTKANEEKEDSSTGVRANSEKQPTFYSIKRQVIVTLIVLTFLSFNVGVSRAVNFRQRIPIKQPFSQFPLQINGWHGIPQTLTEKVLDTLDLSDYILVDYIDDSGHSINFYVAYYESQQKGESIHSPATCLTGGGWELRDSKSILVDVKGLGNPIPVHRAVMSKPGARQLVYYWFYQRGRILTNAYQLKIYNFIDALLKRRTDGALVRLITPIEPDESVVDADQRLSSFMELALPELNKFLPGEVTESSE